MKYWKSNFTRLGEIFIYKVFDLLHFWIFFNSFYVIRSLFTLSIFCKICICRCNTCVKSQFNIKMTEKVKTKIEKVKKLEKKNPMGDLTDEEREAVTIVFHQFETGLREGTIFTKVLRSILLFNSNFLFLSSWILNIDMGCFLQHSILNMFECFLVYPVYLHRILLTIQWYLFRNIGCLRKPYHKDSVLYFNPKCFTIWSKTNAWLKTTHFT